MKQISEKTMGLDKLKERLLESPERRAHAWKRLNPNLEVNFTAPGKIEADLKRLAEEAQGLRREGEERGWHLSDPPPDFIKSQKRKNWELQIRAVADEQLIQREMKRQADRSVEGDWADHRRLEREICRCEPSYQMRVQELRLLNLKHAEVLERIALVNLSQERTTKKKDPGLGLSKPPGLQQEKVPEKKPVRDIELER